MVEMHLLVLAPVPPEYCGRLEAAFDTVEYGELPGLSPSDGAPFSVDEAILQRTTCIFGWELPRNVEKPEDLPNLRWQMTPSAGADRLFTNPFYRVEEVLKRVQLTSNSGVHLSVIPPYVMSMAYLLFAQMKRNFESQIIRQKWERPKGFYIRELSSATFGILGYGRLGRETARLAKAYGARVIAATSDGQRKPDNESKLLCPGLGDPEGDLPEAFFSTKDESSLKDFLGQTDVLVVCLPGTKSTADLIDRNRIAQLTKDAVIINIGRGNVINSDALAEALESGHLAGAALDVTSPEPLTEGHKLWTIKNCIITPHISGVTEKYMSRSIDMLLLNAERFKIGEPLLNSIDPSKAM